MSNNESNSIIYTPGFLFRVLHADTTIKNLFGEHSIHYQAVADSFSFFSDVKIFGLESPIGTESTEGGYYFPITCEELAWLVKQIQGKRNALSESIADNPVWQRIIAFSNRWSTDKSLHAVLDKGEIVERGTYAELMAQSGLFAVLARRQMA